MTRYCAVATCGQLADNRFCRMHSAPTEPDITNGIPARKAGDHPSEVRSADHVISAGPPGPFGVDQTPDLHVDQDSALILVQPQVRGGGPLVHYVGGPRTTPVVRTLTRRETATRREVDRLRASGIWTGHAWGVCSVCGEGAMVPRAGDRKTCFLTRGPDEAGVTRDCPGKLVPEETPTPRQAAQRVVTGLFAATRAVMGARRPLKVPYPKLPKEKP